MYMKINVFRDGFWCGGGGVSSKWMYEWVNNVRLLRKDKREVSEWRGTNKNQQLLDSSDIMEGHVRRVLMHEKVAEASYLPRYCYFAVSRWFAAFPAAEAAER